MIYRPEERTAEARDKREQRKAWRKQPGDPLRERARIAAFWTESNKTNKHYSLVHARALFRNLGFQRLLMPGVRKHIQDKARARRIAYNDQLRKSAKAAAHAKALAKAAPMPLFEPAAA